MHSPVCEKHTERSILMKNSTEHAALLSRVSNKLSIFVNFRTIWSLWNRSVNAFPCMILTTQEVNGDVYWSLLKRINARDSRRQQQKAASPGCFCFPQQPWECWILAQTCQNAEWSREAPEKVFYSPPDSTCRC